MEACGRAAVMGYSLQQPISVKGSAFPLRGEMKLNGVKLWSVKPCKASHFEGSLVTGRPPPSVSVPIPEMSGLRIVGAFGKEYAFGIMELGMAFVVGRGMLGNVLELVGKVEGVEQSSFRLSVQADDATIFEIIFEHFSYLDDLGKTLIRRVLAASTLHLIALSEGLVRFLSQCLHVRPAGSVVPVVSESLDETGGHVKPTRPLLHVLFYIPRESLSRKTSHE
ncbi:hypothetical protein BC332_31110 [Capsicum chinense]|nr:hypothetical protein BC332_31110 [Capsicum chinense]